MALLILMALAFIVGVGLVMGGYLGAAKVPGMMLQRKLDARIEEVTAQPEESASPAAKVKVSRFEEIVAPVAATV